MAFRIHDSVVRGEIDNREKGKVRGCIWVHGRTEPVVLELTGNAHPDLAGCLLKFTNPLKTTPHKHLDSLNPMQKGSIGDLTASRKVRVYDVSVEEAYLMSKRGQKPPEHMANCLYLEWFSEYNGRVVVESADYVLEISAPEWRLTPEEDEQRAKQAAAGMDDFVQKIESMTVEQDAAAATEADDDEDEDEEWDEFAFEKLMRESDARTDKYMALLDKYGDTPEAEELIAKEMGWDKENDKNDDEGEAGDDDDRMTVEEMNRICEEALENPPEPDPLTEGVDWIRTKDNDDDFKHPLCHRAFESVIALMHQVDELGAKEEDEDLGQFVGEFQITSAKLAGALNSLAYGRDHVLPGLVVASLKRALGHLHLAQAGLEKVTARKLLPDDLLAHNRKELFEIREEILRLMEEFRREGSR